MSENISSDPLEGQSVIIIRYPNATNSAEWSGSVILTTIVTCSILLLNISVLPLFLKVKWIDFYAYLINLLLANILFNILASPLEIINNLYPVWWLPEITCSFYLYVSWVLAYVPTYGHVLITANRLWAVTFPISYSRNATTRTAVILCICSWMLAHIFVLPGILFDRIYYKLPIDNDRCVVNVRTAPTSQGSWLLFLQVQCLVCELVIIFAYLYVWYRIKQNRRVHLSKMTNAGRPERVSVRTEDNSFTLLTLLTVNLIVCWTPNIMYFLIMPFADVYDPVIANVVVTISTIPGLVDPILFLMALKDLRQICKTLMSQLFTNPFVT